MSNLQTLYQFKPYFQIVDQHTGGKWLIHGTKHHRDIQWQTLEHPNRKSKHDLHVQSNNQREYQEPELLKYRKPQRVVQNKTNDNKIPIIVKLS